MSEEAPASPAEVLCGAALNRLLAALKKGLVDDFQVIERLGLDTLHVVNSDVHGVVDQGTDGGTSPEARSALRFEAASIEVLCNTVCTVSLVHKQMEDLPDDSRFLFINNKVSDRLVLFVQASLIFQFVTIWDMATPVQAFLHYLRMFGFHANGGFLAFPRCLPEPNVVQQLVYMGIKALVSPFDAQAAKWAPQYQRRHDWLFDEADIVTATGHEYTKSSMFARNRYLVDNADILLTAYDGQPGGTQMTIQYAKQTGIRVCCIKPIV